MSVNSISGISNLNPIDWQNTFAQRKQAFDALEKALQSGDLAGAQKAYASLQQMQPSGTQNQAGQQGNPNSLKSDFDALGQALQSGDVKSAQDAFSKLQQDIQKTPHGHHHHHQHTGKADSNSNNSILETLNANGCNSSGDEYRPANRSSQALSGTNDSAGSLQF